jgi:hypothetical protein
MSDETRHAPGFTEDARPDATSSGLQSGTALSVLWWIADDELVPEDAGIEADERG